MRFNVGSKVRVVATSIYAYQRSLGIGVVIDIYNPRHSHPFKTRFPNNEVRWYDGCDLELAYTIDDYIKAI